MSYSWYRTGTCTTDASDVVRFQSANITTAANKPVVGDAFMVTGIKIYEVIFIGSDATGEYIRLNKPYEEAAVSNAKYAIARFASGTQNAKLVAMASSAINQKQISLDDLHEWYTSEADTVEFLAPDGSVVTLTTYFKLKQELANVGSNAGVITIVSDNIEAVKKVNQEIVAVKNVSDNMAEVKLVNLNAVGMSQAQFEAIRAQNNEEYAASGFVHFGLVGSYNNPPSVNSGLYSTADVPNELYLGRQASDGVGASKESFPRINIAGVITDVVFLKYSATNAVKFPQAPDGKTTYNKSTGARTVHSTTTAAFNAAGADPTNVEVVTDRVDMWGFESFLEEVSATNPYVYPNGLIQSLATTMDGIATSASNRPDTYYAWFGGDTSSKGKGVNYFTLTDAQKRKVLSDHKNKLYFLDDGRLVQWRVRGRSFAGAGNGDWAYSNSISGVLLAFSNTNYVECRGAADSSPDTNEGSTNLYPSNTSPWKPSSAIQDRALFSGAVTSGVATARAVNGECYFLVCGTVNRLNQGAYHPSFNPSGTASWKSSQQSYWACNWNNADGRTKKSGEPTSMASCFTAELGTVGNGGFGNIGAASYDGYGRPDKRFYDAIYSSGQGGVCRDMRYSANHTTLEKLSKADLKVKNGTYRGFEKQVSTKVLKTTWDGNTAVSYGRIGISQSFFAEILAFIGGSGLGAKSFSSHNSGCYVYNASNGKLIIARGIQDSGLTNTNIGVYSDPENPTLAYLGVNTSVFNSNIEGQGVYPNAGTQSSASTAAFGTAGDTLYVVITKEVSGSVGGSFLQTDIIAPPSSILLTDALKNGWYGSWVPDLPAGGGKPHYGTRKNINVTGSPLLTSNNNGATWDSFPTGTQAASVLNGTTGSYATTEIRICQYQAFAKQTEPSVNSAIYGGKSGIGDLWQYGGYFSPVWGSTFVESLLSKIGRSSSGGGGGNHIPLDKVTINPTTLALNTGTGLDGHYHSYIDKPAPNASDIAGCKALMYCTESNQQAGINYAATELVYKPLTYTTITEEATTKSTGTLYKISNGRFSGTIVYWLAGATAPLSSSGWRIVNGDFMFDSELTIYGKVYNNGWGDDSQIHIVDGENTLTDLNGKAVKVVTHKLKEPIGWIKNTI